MTSTQSKDIRQGKGFGYLREDGGIRMIRCFECGRENWLPAVASGQCPWCGYNPNTQGKAGV